MIVKLRGRKPDTFNRLEQQTQKESWLKNKNIKLDEDL